MKTTAIRCLMGLARPNLGRVEVLGRDPWTLDVETKRRIGYMSERPIPFPFARVSDLIDSCSPLYPTWDTELEDRIRCHFSVSRARRLQTLSLGQQRALALLLPPRTAQDEERRQKGHRGEEDGAGGEPRPALRGRRGCAALRTPRTGCATCGRRC